MSDLFDNFNSFLDNPQTFITNIFEKFPKNDDDNQRNYTDIENLTDIDETPNNEYDDLLKRLILIEENMIQIEKILKDKN